MSIKQSHCRGCGKPIVWGQTADGKKIPLDMRAPIYRNAGFVGDDMLIERINGLIDPDTYGVSHFSTCSKASQFSASNKAKDEAR